MRWGEPERDDLRDRLEMIVASFAGDLDRTVPGWELMVRDLRNEPAVSDPPVQAYGIVPLPWASAWDSLRGRRCRSVRDGRSLRGRCELQRGHGCDHARDFGMFPLRWTDRLTEPPIVYAREQPGATDEDRDA